MLGSLLPHLWLPGLTTQGPKQLSQSCSPLGTKGRGFTEMAKEPMESGLCTPSMLPVVRAGKANGHKGGSGNLSLPPKLELEPRPHTFKH